MGMTTSFKISLVNHSSLSFDVSDRGQCNRIVDLLLEDNSTYDFSLQDVLSDDEVEYVKFETFYMCEGEFDGKEKVKSPITLLPIFEKIISNILEDSKQHYQKEADWLQSKYREYLFDLYFLGEIQSILKTAKQLNDDVEIVINFE